MKNLYIIILQYVTNIENIDLHRPEHLKFLEENYQKNIFIASGPQIPRSGGIIIARSPSRTKLEQLLQQDPFYTRRLAKYQIFEFNINRYAPEFREVVDKVIS